VGAADVGGLHIPQIFQYFLEHSGQSIAAEISPLGDELARHSQICEIHCCALGREVSYRELFAKILYQPLVLQIALFQSIPISHEHTSRDDWNKDRLINVRIRKF